MRQCSFILAVEHYLLRKGLSSILGRLPGVKVIRELDSPEKLEKVLSTNSTSFLIISETLFQQCQDLIFQEPDMQDRTLVLLPAEKQNEEIYALPVFRVNDGKEKILHTIHEVMNLRQGQQMCVDEELTPRERTIVKLVSMGMTNKQIADNLFLSTHTVITHRKNISSKLGIKSVSGLTIYAIVNNLVTIEEASAKAGE